MGLFPKSKKGRKINPDQTRMWSSMLKTFFFVIIFKVKHKNNEHYDCDTLKSTNNLF